MALQRSIYQPRAKRVLPAYQNRCNGQNDETVNQLG